MDTIKHLEAYGYAVEEGVVDVEECKKMADALDEMEEGGKTAAKSETQLTIDNIHILRPDVFLNKINIPKITNTASTVLRDHFILSSFNASRSMGPNGGRTPHIDSRMPMPDFANTVQLVCTICLDDFTCLNGATYVWPFSHKSKENAPDHYDGTNIPGKISATAPRGSVLYFVAQLWHDIGPNLDGNRRWGIHAVYSRWWIKPVFDFTACGPEIYNKLTLEQKVLFGFNSTPPRPRGKRRYTRTRMEDIPNDYNEALQWITSLTYSDTARQIKDYKRKN